MIAHIAAQEFRRLFLSPLAWTVLAVVQFIIAYFFLSAVDNYLLWQPRLAAIEGAPGVTDLVVAQVYGSSSLLLLFAVPLMTMRVISEERRAQTLAVLFSAPLSMTEIVLGKYLGVLGFFLVQVALIGVMPLSLLLGGGLDFGMYAAGLLGITLLVASFIAVGVFMSALTAQPTIAAVSTFGILLLLWIVDWAGQARADEMSGTLAHFSMLRHYEVLLKGVVNSADVIYYLLFIVTFLILSVRRLDADRLQH